MTNSSTSTGQYYEALARDYLVQQGMTLIEQNYHSRFGEIDLIMFDQKVLCFIEVKAMHSEELLQPFLGLNNRK